jgi:hypothetical protein
MIVSLLALLTVASAPVSAAPLNEPGVRAADSGKSLFQRVSNRYRAVLEGVSFYYLTQADRKQMLEDFFRAMEADYSLLELKEERIQLNYEALKAAAFAAEESNPNVSEERLQAEGNLAFYARMRKLVASFKDTHLSIRTRLALHPAILPIAVAEVEGKFIVANRYPKLLQLLADEDSAFGEIKLGDEVLSLDGVPIKEARNQLLPYQSASSDLARETYANQALTFRAFPLPSNPFVVVELKQSSGRVLKLKFPWFYRQPPRGDQAFYFKVNNFRRYDDLRMDWDSNKKKWTVTGMPPERSDFENSLPALLGEKKYTNPEKTETIIKTGFLLKEGKAIGVLQVNSFSEIKLKIGERDLSFRDSLVEFVVEAKKANTPIILDLRSNPGGNSRLTSTLVSVLTEKEKTYSSHSSAYPITRYTQQLVDQFSGNRDLIPEEVSGLTTEQFRDLFYRALRARLPFTDSYSNPEISADEAVKGYGGKIVALIGPNCVSSCDITAALLKHSKRAVLMGMPANGTGAGFSSSKELNTEWTDSNRVFTLTIPNHLFGVPGGPVGQPMLSGRTEELNMENRPTLPDQEYSLTAEDILQDSAGWIRKALELLEAPR